MATRVGASPAMATRRSTGTWRSKTLGKGLRHDDDDDDDEEEEEEEDEEEEDDDDNDDLTRYQKQP